MQRVGDRTPGVRGVQPEETGRERPEVSDLGLEAVCPWASYMRSLFSHFFIWKKGYQISDS